jgi:preprotein translocase subunit Sec63
LRTFCLSVLFILRKVSAQFNDRKTRQSTLRARKNELESHQKYKETAFKAKQDEKLQEAVAKFGEDQRKSVAETERSFLIHKQVNLKKIHSPPF